MKTEDKIRSCVACPVLTVVLLSAVPWQWTQRRRRSSRSMWTACGLVPLSTATKHRESDSGCGRLHSYTHMYTNTVALTLSSISGRRKVRRNALQCSALNRSILRASMALIRYSFTSSSGSFSSRLSLKPTLQSNVQLHTSSLSY